MAASNFNIRQLITKTLSTTLKLMRVTTELLMIPLKRMKIGRLKRRNVHKKPRPKPKNMGQYDGNDDSEDWSTDSEAENSFSATTEEPNVDCGWYKKLMEKQPKGIVYWYNPKRPRDKYSELRNAPKMNPPDIKKQEGNTGRRHTG